MVVSEYIKMIFINKNLITVEDEEKIKCKDLSKRGFAIILTLKRLGQGGGVNFTKTPQVVQKIWRFAPSILTIFINFSDFFGISLLQRN